MKTLRTLLLIAACLAPSFAAVTDARADGCYLCGSGSSSSCKDYCRYGSKDTFDARKACEKRGCKVSGTGSCPTAVNYKVCMAPVPNNDNANQTVAQIPWCATDKRS